MVFQPTLREQAVEPHQFRISWRDPRTQSGNFQLPSLSAVRAVIGRERHGNRALMSSWWALLLCLSAVRAVIGRERHGNRALMPSWWASLLCLSAVRAAIGKQRLCNRALVSWWWASLSCLSTVQAVIGSERHSNRALIPHGGPFCHRLRLVLRLAIN
jgi:hypothetical protein